MIFRPDVLLALALWQYEATPPVPVNLSHLRYKRPLAMQKRGLACATLDGRVFLHAASAPKDLRLFSLKQEISYAITLSESAQVEREADGQVWGAVYTPVAQVERVVERGGETVAVFRVGGRVPVERVWVEVGAGVGNFSRKVRVTARADAPGSLTEVVDGTISRVRMGAIRQEQMGFAASLGANLQGDATVEVAIENGDEPPLPVSSVTLGMRERKICFDAPGSPVTLYYGDPELAAPDYGDLGRFFRFESGGYGASGSGNAQSSVPGAGR